MRTNRLSPSFECLNGRHLATFTGSSGTIYCQWCLAVVVAAPSTTSQPRNAGDSAPTVGGCCGDTLTRQANYPRPTITERKDDIAVEIDSRFWQQVDRHIAERPGLRAWLKDNPGKSFGGKR